MNWKTIRLELARTREFPRGSVSRAYLLRVPLDQAGMIDERAIAASPSRATVRRFWPSQPDRIGCVSRCDCGWCFCFDSTGENAVLSLDCEPLKLGREVTIAAPDGTHLPFLVASMKHTSSNLRS